jgi:hypothetical protein
VKTGAPCAIERQTARLRGVLHAHRNAAEAARAGGPHWPHPPSARRKGALARVLSPREARHRDEVHRLNRARSSTPRRLRRAGDFEDWDWGDAIARQREVRRKIDLARAGTHY